MSGGVLKIAPDRKQGYCDFKGLFTRAGDVGQKSTKIRLIGEWTLFLGILCGTAFGMIDAAMVVFGKHPDKSLAMLSYRLFSAALPSAFLLPTSRSECIQQFRVPSWVC